VFQFKNDKIFTLLCEEAKKSEFENHKHASCICHKGRVLALETNQKKSHTIQKRFSTSEKKVWLHSEIACIIRVVNLYGVEILKDCELYNIRLTKALKVGNSKPCDGCAKAIEAFGIGKVFYT